MNHKKPRPIRDLPRGIDEFEELYLSCKMRIFRRLDRDLLSIRQAAKDVGTSHMTIQRMRKYPDYVPAYRTKAKFIRAFVAPRPKTKRRIPRVFSHAGINLTCAK